MLHLHIENVIPQILQDGTYLELISFTHPAADYPPSSPQRAKRDSHQWARQVPGWVAFSFLGAPSASPSISAIINSRAERDGRDVRYASEVAGGRRRGDGVELKWEITAPEKWQEKTTQVPFFCGDVTSRSLRVLLEPKSNWHHPNGSNSVAHLTILTPQASLDDVSKDLQSILGDHPITLSASTHVWLLDPLPDVNKGKPPEWHPRLILQAANEGDEDEVTFLQAHGPGLYEVAFRTSGGETGSTKTPYGKVSWVGADVENSAVLSNV
ncbi:hypothetical protein EWM64_g1980 [Hericium alpestre]|uniref:Glyoxalase-like domain-containing protein n=1 Tax=Hericium alpestre TaxID=135208 RepID=A0A4Z0A7X4_9AGAM|nr:hypothetical protein EWM64_g1980 [Hericium alpestre]